MGHWLYMFRLGRYALSLALSGRRAELLRIALIHLRWAGPSQTLGLVQFDLGRAGRGLLRSEGSRFDP